MPAAPPLPVSSGRLVSRFGTRRSLQNPSVIRMHAGTDIGPTTRSTPVLAVEGGTVEKIGRNEDPNDPLRGYGNAVVISHGNGTWALYAHLERPMVSQGQRVEAGAQLGLVGNTTNGQFSPLPGESRAQWTARRTRETGRAPRFMNPHLHIELRRAREDGTSPFSPRPTPYPDTPEAARYNLDPQAWMAAKGVTFGRRGAIEITPGSEADQHRARWGALSGVLAVMGTDGLGALPTTGGKTGSSPAVTTGGGYQPGGYEPVEFERDTKFGLTDGEWAALGAGAVVLTGGVAALALRASLRRNPSRAERLRGGFGSKKRRSSRR